MTSPAQRSTTSTERPAVRPDIPAGHAGPTRNARPGPAGRPTGKPSVVIPGDPALPFSRRHARLSVTVLPNACPEDIQLEYQAMPGGLLGGPFTLRPGGRALRTVAPGALQALHLAYLKDGYLHSKDLRLLIDQMGGQLLYGRNRMGILTYHQEIGENICRAVLGVMHRASLALTEEGGDLLPPARHIGLTS